MNWTPIQTGWSGGYFETIDPQQILQYQECQPRVNGVDPNVVAEYAMDMRNYDEAEKGVPGWKKFPHIYCVKTHDDRHILVSGFHRLDAILRVGYERIEVYCIDGTLQDAILLSKGENANNGVRRTNADKEYIVRSCLLDVELRKWSNEQIAEWCGVAPKTVKNHEDRLCKLQREKGEDYNRPTVRLFMKKDGTVGEKDTSEIGNRSSKTEAEIAVLKPSFHNAVETWRSLQVERLQKFERLPVGRTPLLDSEYIKTYFELADPRIPQNTKPTAVHYEGAIECMQDRPVAFAEQLEGRHYRRIIKDWDESVLPQLIKRFQGPLLGYSTSQLKAEAFEVRIKRAIRRQYEFQGRIPSQPFEVLFEITEDAHAVLIQLNPKEWVRDGREISWAVSVLPEPIDTPAAEEIAGEKTAGENAFETAQTEYFKARADLTAFINEKEISLSDFIEATKTQYHRTNVAAMFGQPSDIRKDSTLTTGIFEDWTGFMRVLYVDVKAPAAWVPIPKQTDEETRTGEGTSPVQEAKTSTVLQAEADTPDYEKIQAEHVKRLKETLPDEIREYIPKWIAANVGGVSNPDSPRSRSILPRGNGRPS